MPESSKKVRKDKNGETFHSHFLHEFMKRREDYEEAIADYDIVPDDANAPDGRDDGKPCVRARCGAGGG
jgi:hypothetical protein